MNGSFGTAPAIEDIESIAMEAVAALPEAFRDRAKDVVLRVEDAPSDEMLASLGIDDPLDLTGLYEGTPLTDKSISDPYPQPDTVWLFRYAILDEWISRGNVTLSDLVAHIVVHELAHHFGWTDEEIATIDRWWE